MGWLLHAFSARALDLAVALSTILRLIFPALLTLLGASSLCYRFLAQFLYFIPLVSYIWGRSLTHRTRCITMFYLIVNSNLSILIEAFGIMDLASELKIRSTLHVRFQLLFS